VAQAVGPEFKPQYSQKKKDKREEYLNKLSNMFLDESTVN
jgi:hypothetical protein